MQVMDEGARRWMLKTARANFWRVASWMEFEDLIQDGYMHYARLVARYHNVKNRAQIMSLFKTTFNNHFHDISKKRTKQIDVPVSDVMPDQQSADIFFELNGGSEIDLSNLMLAPQQVITALQALGADKAARILKSQYRKRLNGTRETTNERFCRIAGVNPDQFSLHSVLRTYLKDAV